MFTHASSGAFFLLRDVKGWISYECSKCMLSHKNIPISDNPPVHPPREEKPHLKLQGHNKQMSKTFFMLKSKLHTHTVMPVDVKAFKAFILS